ncbi:MAG: crosslink repair DNA glycosylase YcaQ family protein [Myxococcota bacterium]
MARRVVELVNRQGPVSQRWLRRALCSSDQGLAPRGLVVGALREALADRRIAVHRFPDDHDASRVFYVGTSPEARRRAEVRLALRVLRILGAATAAELARTIGVEPGRVLRALHLARESGQVVSTWPQSGSQVGGMLWRVAQRRPRVAGSPRPKPGQIPTTNPARPMATAARAALVRRLLASRGPMTVAELVRALGCSRTTVRRALEAAKTLGVERITGPPRGAGRPADLWRISGGEAP